MKELIGTITIGFIFGMAFGMFFSNFSWKSQIKFKANSLIDMMVGGKFYKIRENKDRNL